VPRGDDKDVALARSLGRLLARTFEGAVYDPQEDSIVFSSAGARRFRRPRGEERLAVLKLLWVLPSRPGPETPARFLDSLRALPEARPTRFGTFEPLQGRLPPHDGSPFVAQWEEEIEKPGGSFFWKARGPFFGGSVYFPAGSWPPREIPRRARKVSQINIEVDSRALQQPAWREGIADLFQQTAVGIGAVYGAAYLEGGWIVGGRSLWADGMLATEWDFNIVYGEWHGLPPAASWLTWFGRVYRNKVKTALTDRTTQVGDGLLLRVGDEPRLPAEIGSDYPELPQDVVWHYRNEPIAKDRDTPRETAVWLPKF
jgi:hypothetical protein